MHSGLIQSGVPHLLSGEVRQEDIPFRTGKRPVPLSLPPDEERLVEAIATGDRAAADIARVARVSILELARIITTPENLAQLRQVAQLHAKQREMLLGQLKLNALVRLGELTAEVPAASADECRASEIMRKACVDLLRYAPGNANAARNAFVIQFSVTQQTRRIRGQTGESARVTETLPTLRGGRASR